MGSAHSHLKRCYAIRGGKIDPWGTIRVLTNGVVDPGNLATAPLYSQTGLVVWSEKLVQYGNSHFHVRISENTVLVLGKGDSLVEEISHEEFLVVEIDEALVLNDGHLVTLVGSTDWWNGWKTALSQAAAGEKPHLMSNSAFVLVDKKFASQKVIKLSWDFLMNPHVAVFTESGERIPSLVHYPLSYAKWEPWNGYANPNVTESESVTS